MDLDLDYNRELLDLNPPTLIKAGTFDLLT